LQETIKQLHQFLFCLLHFIVLRGEYVDKKDLLAVPKMPFKEIDQ